MESGGDGPLTYNELSEQWRKQAAVIEYLSDALAKTRSRFRNMLMSFPLGLIVTDENFNIEAVNQQIQYVFQYGSDELVGKPISFLFPKLKTVEVSPKPITEMAKRKSTEMFPTEIIVTPYEEQGAQRLFIHVADITEKHRLEQFKQDLIAMVSHDLRTPLTAIRGVLTLVDEGAYGDIAPAGHKSIARAQSSADYLISLVKDLLDAEKVESGTIQIDVQETSCGAVANKAAYAVQGAAEEAKVTVDLDITNDVFYGDEDRLVQVLINLISNAIKFSPQGGFVKVTAGIEGTGVKFMVADRGPGIPQHFRGTIFERYKQLPQEKEVKKRGFGLGLAICKALVEEHKGTIGVESEVGKGSKFWFRVPQMPE